MHAGLIELHMYRVWCKSTQEGIVSLIWAGVGLWEHEARPITGAFTLIKGISFPFVEAQTLVKDVWCIDCSYQKSPYSYRVCIVLFLSYTHEQETVKLRWGWGGGNAFIWYRLLYSWERQQGC